MKVEIDITPYLDTVYTNYIHTPEVHRHVRHMALPICTYNINRLCKIKEKAELPPKPGTPLTYYFPE